jgi:uncharacterized protein (TIRG00374 family)
VKGKIKQPLQVIIFLALGLGFIWWFISKLSIKEREDLYASFSNADYFWLIIALVISIASCYIRALRWKQLLKPMGYCKVSTTTSFLAVMSGYLTNLAVPRLGEVVRCAMLKKSNQIPIEKTLGTVIVERAIDLIIFGLVMIIALFFGLNVIKNYAQANIDAAVVEKLKNLSIIVFIVLVIGILFFTLARHKLKNKQFFIKIKAILLNLLQGMKSIFYLEKSILFIFYSFLIWFLWILGTYAIFQCFEVTSSLGFKVALVVTVLSSFGPMITPGGIGLYPAIVAETLLIYAIAKPIGYATGWLSWLVSQLGIVVLGLVGFVYFSKKHKSNDSNK